jgi:hypothetical protein
MFVFRTVRNMGSSHATSEEARDGEPRLAAMQEGIASQVSPGASMGETHASNGRSRMAALGLRKARRA